MARLKMIRKNLIDLTGASRHFLSSPCLRKGSVLSVTWSVTNYSREEMTKTMVQRGDEGREKGWK